MAEFFHAGGVGMYPTLLFGFFLVASGVLFLLRPEQRYIPLLVSLGITTVSSGLLNFCLGLLQTFLYLQKVPPADQFKIAALGVQESLNNVVLVLILVVLTALITSVGSWRAIRAGAST